jgi:LUD domain
VGVNVTGRLYGRRDLVTFDGCGWSYKRDAHVRESEKEAREGALPMSAIQASDRFTALPDERTLAETLVALEGRGFSVEVVDHLDAARERVLARIPEGSSVMTYPSVTLEATGIAHAVDKGERYDSVRAKGLGLDRETQLHEIKAIMVLTEFALGSVHAITRDGTLVIASALGSQLSSYAWGAANVIFVVGAQKLVPDLAAAHERISQHCLKLEDARTLKVYGKSSRIGKILEIHQEDPGRIHVVLIRAVVGF